MVGTSQLVMHVYSGFHSNLFFGSLCGMWDLFVCVCVCVCVCVIKFYLSIKEIEKASDIGIRRGQKEYPPPASL